MSSSYQFTLELIDERDVSIEQTAVEPNWQAAFECAGFEAARRAEGPLVTAPAKGVILPLWDAELGEPHVGAFRVDVRLDPAAAYSHEIPLTYLAWQAQELSAKLIDRGAIDPAAPVRYRVCAFPKTEPTSAARFGIDLEDVDDTLPVVDASLDNLRSRARRFGGSDPEAGELPVVVDSAVTKEIVELAEASPEVESGGLLIGHLHRDGEGGDLFVEITDQLPARHTEATATKLTFTTDTWADARATLSLRRRDEILLGWWHHHTPFCRDCPAERRRTCPLRREFFSADDVHFQTTMFGRAFHLALLVTLDLERPPAVAMFGWRDGGIRRRDFDLVDRPRSSTVNNGGPQP